MITVNSKQIQAVFAAYESARTKFVTTISELALRPRNIYDLQLNNVMELLKPLLNDTVAAIQQTAAQAIGRLAKHSEKIAESIVKADLLPRLVDGLSHESVIPFQSFQYLTIVQRYYKSNSASVLRSVAKHNAKLAQSVVDANAVEPLLKCMDDFDPNVKENAAWVLNHIVTHNQSLAETVVKKGVIPPLVESLNEPEIPLKRIAASTLGNIAKHTQELAQAVVDAEALPSLISLLDVQDAQLRAQVCSCLTHISKHCIDMAELIVEADIFNKLFALLKDEEVNVRRAAAGCVKELAKHTPEIAQLIVNLGGLNSIVSYVDSVKGDAKAPGIMTLGFISGFSEHLANAVIKAKGIPILNHALVTEPAEHVKGAAAWSLGQIGRHSPQHAKSVSESRVLATMLEVYLDKKSTPELRAKCEKAMISIITASKHLDDMYPLLTEQTPDDVLKAVVQQCAKLLPKDIALKKQFAEHGGLEKLQILKDKKGEDIQQGIEVINACYPDEVVQFYTPGYDKILLGKIKSKK